MIILVDFDRVIYDKDSMFEALIATYESYGILRSVVIEA